MKTATIPKDCHSDRTIFIEIIDLHNRALDFHMYVEQVSPMFAANIGSTVELDNAREEHWAKGVDTHGRSRSTVLPDKNPKSHPNNMCRRIAVSVG